MVGKRIELKANNVISSKNVTNVFYYCVSYFNPDNEETGDRRPEQIVHLFFENVEEHFVLIEHSWQLPIYKYPYSGNELFGVEHTAEEADRRLYQRAKEKAEWIARENGVRDLEDLTSHYQSLPRGGK